MTLTDLIAELHQRTGLGEAEIREVVQESFPLEYLPGAWDGYNKADMEFAERIIRQKAAPLSEGQGRV